MSLVIPPVLVTPPCRDWAPRDEAVAVAVVAVVAAVAVAAPLRKGASERPPSAAAKLTAWLG